MKGSKEMSNLAGHLEEKLLRTGNILVQYESRKTNSHSYLTNFQKESNQKRH